MASVLALVVVALVGPWGGLRGMIYEESVWVVVPWPHGGGYWIRQVPDVWGFLWLVALAGVSGVVSGVLFWSAFRKRGAAPPGSGCCERCGYDLRSSEERCPECGALIWVDRGAKAGAGRK